MLFQKLPHIAKAIKGPEKRDKREEESKRGEEAGSREVSRDEGVCSLSLSHTVCVRVLSPSVAQRYQQPSILSLPVHSQTLGFPNRSFSPNKSLLLSLSLAFREAHSSSRSHTHHKTHPLIAALLHERPKHDVVRESVCRNDG